MDGIDPKLKAHQARILDFLDEDIAEAYTNFGLGKFNSDQPIKLQLVRVLSRIADALERRCHTK